MNIAKFVEETKVIENKLRQKAADKSGRLSFPILLKQLQDEGEIDEQIVTNLKKLWEIRNKIHSSLAIKDNILDEEKMLLDSLMSDPKLQ